MVEVNLCKWSPLYEILRCFCALGARSGRVRLTSNDIGGSTVYKSQPCVYKAPASSVVDRVLLTANDTDQFLVKVMVRQCRRPEVGDKSTQSMIIESGAMGLDNGLHVDLQVATGRRVCAVQLCHKFHISISDEILRVLSIFGSINPLYSSN
mmetsp:Transcript_10218/g.35280  ORF Transcript_10218/g.35280 Transcript_10218/m.35280 type:complete len:152 (-) Transcript_10218:2072-2527(-)